MAPTKHAEEEPLRSQIGCLRDFPELDPGDRSYIPRSAPIPNISILDSTTSSIGQRHTLESLETMGSADSNLQEDIVHPVTSISNDVGQSRGKIEPVGGAIPRTAFSALRKLTIEDVLNEAMSESNYTFEPKSMKMKDLVDNETEIAQASSSGPPRKLVDVYFKGMVLRVCQICEGRPRSVHSCNNCRGTGCTYSPTVPELDAQFESSAKHKVDFGLPTAHHLHQSAKSLDERLQGKRKLSPNEVLDLDSRILHLKTAEGVDLAPLGKSNSTVNSCTSELSIALDLEHLHLDEPSEPPASIDSATDADADLSIASPPLHSIHPKSPDGLENSMRRGIGSWTEECGGNSLHVSVTAKTLEPNILKAISSMPDELYSQFYKKWLTNLRQCTGRPQESNREYSRPSLSPSKNSSSTSHKTSARSPGDDELDENNSDDESPQHQGPPFGPFSSMTKSFLFACPFHQYDPQYFSASDLNGRTYRTCGYNGWKSVSRVKEHVYRCHLDPIYCRACGIVFKTPPELEHHLHNQATVCNSHEYNPRNEIQHLGITVQQKQAIKANKRRGNTDEDRWKEMYQIIFPGEPVPNPYYGNPEEHPEQAKTLVAVHDRQERVCRLVRDADFDHSECERLEAFTISIINRRQGNENRSSHIHQPVHQDHAAFGPNVDFGLEENPLSQSATLNLNMAQSMPFMQSPYLHKPIGDPPGPVSWREAPPLLSTDFAQPQKLNSYPSDDLSNFITRPPSLGFGYNSNYMNTSGLADTVDTGAYELYRPQTQDSQLSTLSSIFSSPGGAQSSDGSSVECNAYLTAVPNTDPLGSALEF